MKHESPAQGRASADALNVERKSSEEDRHVAFTAKQRRRWSPLTVDGILARSPSTAQAHDLALAIGKVMRRDGTFLESRDDSDGICVEISRPIATRSRRPSGSRPGPGASTSDSGRPLALLTDAGT